MFRRFDVGQGSRGLRCLVSCSTAVPAAGEALAAQGSSKLVVMLVPTSRSGHTGLEMGCKMFACCGV